MVLTADCLYGRIGGGNAECGGKNAAAQAVRAARPGDGAGGSGQPDTGRVGGGQRGRVQMHTLE